MGWRRRAGGGKRDIAEKAILTAWRSVGAQCWQVGGTGNPDVLVRFRGILYGFEIKTGKGRETANQGEWPIIRTAQEALEAVGAVARIGE
jgi:hypothetical protein